MSVFTRQGCHEPTTSCCRADSIRKQSQHAISYIAHDSLKQIEQRNRTLKQCYLIIGSQNDRQIAQQEIVFDFDEYIGFKTNNKFPILISNLKSRNNVQLLLLLIRVTGSFDLEFPFEFARARSSLLQELEENNLIKLK